jgi:hypothetical protein
MHSPDIWGSWMRNAEQVRENSPEPVEYFAAIQIDARGMEPFTPFVERLNSIGGQHWTYMFDDGRTSVTMTNRLRHLTLGQNICTEYSVATRASHMLFMAADCMPPDDIMPRMLEMNHPLCAPYIRTYGLVGPNISNYPFPVMDAMASAACIFINSDVFRRLRWRSDYEHGSDDPCYHRDAKELLNIPTHVRKDVFAKHFPEAIGSYEARGFNTEVIRP